MAWTRENDFHVHSGRYNVGPRILGKEVKGAGETPALLKTMAQVKGLGSEDPSYINRQTTSRKFERNT